MTSTVNAAMSIRTHGAAQRALRHATSASEATHDSVGRLSSGLRVRSSAAGVAVLSSTEVARANRTGIQRGLRNAQEAIGMLQTAESGMAAMADLYIRMREIAVAASGNEISIDERQILEDDYQATRLEALRIAEVTAYGDHKLLDGTGGAAGNGVYVFQVGFQADTDARNKLKIGSQINTTLHTGSGVKSADHARRAIDIIDDALNGAGGIHDSRAKVGSSIRVLTSGVSFLMDQGANFATAIGERRDLDLSDESTNLRKDQLLQNAGIAMLAQANAQSSVALRLLG